MQEIYFYGSDVEISISIRFSGQIDGGWQLLEQNTSNTIDMVIPRVNNRKFPITYSW